MPTLAILTWPVFALMFFAQLRRPQALIWATTVPYLFLPEAFAIDLPGLPDLDKTAIISIGLGLGILANRHSGRTGMEPVPPGSTDSAIGKIVILCLLIFFLGSVATILNNSESLVFGSTYLPALRPWDGISEVGRMVFFLAPFFLAYRYLSSPVMHRKLLVCIVVMGLVYSLLMLVEMRLSPQLHRWVYGFHQHSFLQHIRDGFRPMVFLQHGLWVGFFIFSAVMASAALWKTERHGKWLAAGIYLFVILLLSENLAASLICMVALVTFFLLPGKMQIAVLAALTLAILIYPALRQSGVVPTEAFVSAAEEISIDRAQSLQFRLENEDALLERALEKPWTGWGSYGRDQVYDETGQDISVSEGRWIQTLGTRGWLGYIGLFGLLTVPILALFFRTFARKDDVPPETLVLALVCAGNLIYMIPNSTLTPVGWLFFGALAGFARYRSEEQEPEAVQSARDRAARTLRYTRFAPRT